MSRFAALGCLEAMWHFTGRFTPQGNIGKYTDEAIEAWLEWDGVPGLLIDAMVESKRIDRDSQRRPVTLNDILIIAPYNAQVFELRDRLPGARIGTVDKFQGQEAAVVLISMATSSGDDLPRQIEFLYSRNRLNVAISRARCSAILFASPRLLEIPCHTISQMELVNALCWMRSYSEMQARHHMTPR